MTLVSKIELHNLPTTSSAVQKSPVIFAKILLLIISQLVDKYLSMFLHVVMYIAELTVFHDYNQFPCNTNKRVTQLLTGRDKSRTDGKGVYTFSQLQRSYSVFCQKNRQSSSKKLRHYKKMNLSRLIPSNYLIFFLYYLFM